MKKVYVNVTVQLVLEMEDGADVGEVVSEMDYDFTSKTDGVGIVGTEICDHVVTLTR